MSNDQLTTDDCGRSKSKVSGGGGGGGGGIAADTTAYDHP